MPSAFPPAPLTEAESRVLRYLPTNLSAPEIAAELFCSVNTVKTRPWAGHRYPTPPTAAW